MMTLSLLLGVGLLGVVADVSAVRISVDASKVVAEVPRTLYGSGLEDVNHEIYGGLDAQRLYDESFEEQEIEPVAGQGVRPKPMWVCGRQWRVMTTAGGRVAVDRRDPHLGAVSVALEPGNGTAAVANAGLNGWGVPCRAGKRMRGRFFAKGEVGNLSVSLRGRNDGHVHARSQVSLLKTNGWQCVDFALVPDTTDAAAEFVICAADGGRTLVDDAYLADEPTNEFGRIGCREDIVDGFRREGLTFLRWGGSMANSWGYLWKNMKDDRRPYDGFWFRTSSTGFLYREFVRMADAMKLPCAFSIYAYEQVAKTVEIAEWLKRFDGDVYVQVGNEECAGCTPTCGEFTLGDCRRYCESLRLIVTEMRKVNSRLKFVSALMFDSRHQEVMDEGFRLTDGYVDYWDVHLQLFGTDVRKVVDATRREVGAFRDMVRRLNPQTRMKMAIFEENGNEHGLRRALVHAGVLGICRELGDFLLTSCPANALQPYLQNQNGWDQGQIFFTPDKVWLQPCGWAQQMASANHRDLLVAGTSSDPQVMVSATKSRDGKSLVLHLVNVAKTARALDLSFADGGTWKVERVTVLSGDDPLADNTPEAPLRISPADETAEFLRRPLLKPSSYSVIVTSTSRTADPSVKDYKSMGEESRPDKREPIGFAIEENRKGLVYNPGEEAVFIVTATNGMGGKVSSGSLKVTVSDYTMRPGRTHEVDLSRENPFVMRGTMTEPGFLRFEIEGEGVTKTVRGAAFAPERIRAAGTCPKDFDAFWSEAKARLAREVPLDPRLVHVPERSTDKFDFWRVSFATFGGQRVWGFLTVPKDKSKAPFPVRFSISSAGTGRWTWDFESARYQDEVINMSFTVHRFEPPTNQADADRLHKRLAGELKAECGVTSYPVAGLGKSREDAYFYRPILGIDRAVDWLWSRPDVDRRRFIYRGGSQGGGLGMILLGLNHRFTAALLHVPAMMDMLGSEVGRECGFPYLKDCYENRADRDAAFANAAYYNGAFFAARVTCPVRISMGFIDDVCPPTGVYAGYNALRVKERQILHGLYRAHGWWPEAEVWERWLR